MSNCSSCSAGRRCGHDFSSRAPQKPSLVDLEVVRDFFTVSFLRISNAMDECRNGTMTQEDLKKKCDAIATRLMEIFCGYFSNYEEGPEYWNPHGLADALREILGRHGEWEEEGVPKSDETVVYQGSVIYIKQCMRAAQDKAEEGIVIRQKRDITPDVEGFIENWAMIYAGAVMY